MARRQHQFDYLMGRIAVGGLTRIDLTNLNPDTDDIDQLIEALSTSKNAESLKLNHAKLGDDDIIRVVEVLQDIPTLEMLDLTGNNLTDEGIAQICDLLRDHPCLQSLSLYSNKLTDEGIKTLADFVRDAPKIRKLNISNNNVNREGFLALGDAIADSPQFSWLSIKTNHGVLAQEDYQDFLDKMEATHHSNLIRVEHNAAHTQLGLFCSNNYEQVNELFDMMTKLDFDTNLSMLWTNMAEHIPAMETHLLKVDSHRTNPMLSNKREKLAAFKEFVSGLPEPDFSQPTVLAALTTKQGEYGAIDNPSTWLNMESTLARLGEHGLTLRKADFIGADGEMTDIAKHAASCGKMPNLFTVEAWKDSSLHELRETYQGLPEAVQDQIPNYRQLVTAISRQEASATRER